MFGQAHAREFSVVLSLKTRSAVRRPAGVEAKSDACPLDEQARALRDPDAAGRALVAGAHDGDYGRAIGAEARKPDYDWIRILDQPVPPNPTVAERAAELRHATRSSS